MRTAHLLSRGIAGLLLITLVVNWRLTALLFSPTRLDHLLTAVIVLFLALLVTSILGLLQVRPWGFVALYLLVPVSTVLHGISLVPLLPRLLSPATRPAAVFVLNAAVLLCAVIAHVQYRNPLRVSTQAPKSRRRA